MAKEVIMPKFGFTQESAEIVKWLKQDGDTVEMGDPIAEVTTDKVNMEVEATENGILAGILFKEGDVVPVTQVIAYIVKPGESVPQGKAAAPQSPPAVVSPPIEPVPADDASPAAITPVAMRVAQNLGVNPNLVVGTGIGGRVTREDVESFAHSQPADGKVRATPAARRIAREQQIDLHAVKGTGPNARIQGSDLTQIISVQPAAQTAPAKQKPAPVGDMEAKVVPMTSIRRTIAERLQHSYQQAPHIYFDADVDVSALDALRQRANQMPQAKDAKVSITALLIRIVSWALTKHPYVNSRLDDNKILLFTDVNVGMAVALENGLIVPVIRNSDKKSVFNIASEMNALVERARLGQLQPDDLTNGTFTISNLGMFGIDRFTAIINPPQTAILAVGRSVKKFVPDETGQPVVRSMMTITLSADHRVIDGAVAARFLDDLRKGIEQPELHCASVKRTPIPVHVQNRRAGRACPEKYKVQPPGTSRIIADVQIVPPLHRCSRRQPR